MFLINYAQLEIPFRSMRFLSKCIGMKTSLIIAVIKTFNSRTDPVDVGISVREVEISSRTLTLVLNWSLSPSYLTWRANTLIH